VGAGGTAPGRSHAELEEAEPSLLQPVMVASVTTHSRSPTMQSGRAVIFATLFLFHESDVEILSRSLSINESAYSDVGARVASANADARQIHYLLTRLFVT
jgi:hypothetical protein